MTDEDLLSPLLPFVDRAATARALSIVPPPLPDHLICGRLGSTHFVVTLDGDHDCEASLSVEHGRPTKAQVVAFFRRWGVEPISKEALLISNGKALHFIVRRGTRQ